MPCPPISPATCSRPSRGRSRCSTTTARDEQQAALLKVFTGQLDGGIADLAGLIGEVVSVERVPITFTVDGGTGRLRIGSIADAQMAPCTGATG